MIKRIVLLIFVFLVLMGAIIFCFKKQNEASIQENKFTFWTIQLKPIYEKQINEAIAKINERHPDVEIVWVDIPIQEAQKRTLASILSSTPPDLINLNPDFSHVLAKINALEYFDVSETWQFHPSLVEKLKYKGKIYGLPYYATSPVTVYNKEVYSKCESGEFPKSYDELFLKSQKLKDCSKMPIFVSSLNENDTLYKFLNKYGVQKFQTMQEQNKTIKIYTMLNDMYKKGFMPKDTLSVNHREVVEKYMSNQTLAIVVGSNFIKMIKQNSPDIYKKSQISQQLVGENRKFDVSLMNFVIPKKAKNKQMAREFIFELTKIDSQIELAKLTNVLPANKYALNDEYFKKCANDLEEQSRCESVKQLNNIFIETAEIADKKAVNEILNKTLEEILLDKNSSLTSIEAKIKTLFPQLKSYIR